MNRIEEQYRGLLGTLLENSIEKEDRTGTGTLSVFGRQIRHDMKDGFPLLTTKKMAVKTMMTELKWFLKGDTNIKYLVENGCNIWNGDAYKNYRNKFELSPYQFTPDTMEEFINKIKTDDEFAEEWGELGPIYGKQWRSWKGDTWVEGNTDGTEGFYLQSETIDQIQNLINELKTNPDSRRLMVNAWNVGELEDMTLPPCHYGFQVYTRKTTRQEKIVNPGKYRAISLMWNQRSVDTFLGLPFNIASYAALLCLIAEEVNMVPDQLIGNLGDVHLYKNHEDQAREQLTREIYDLPTVEFSNMNLLDGEFDYEIKDYKYHPSIKATLSN
ncbi:thymidylate synthase [bacterium]|nr:thymidylate synthase [bacterium]